MNKFKQSVGTAEGSTRFIRRLLRLSALVGCTTLAFGLAIAAFSRTSALPNGQKQQDFGVPELHKINSATLGPSYSCRSAEQVQRGYEDTALFLSKFSRDMHSPELLFDGACRGEDFLWTTSGGPSMSLIEDMGEIPLEDATAQMAIGSPGLRFDRRVKIQLHHTYAVLLNESLVRGLFVFTVVGRVPHQRLDVSYAVKRYQVLSWQSESPGFDWGKHNLY